MNAITAIPALLTTEQAAQVLGISIGALQNDRCAGARIPYVKIGRVVRYKAEDLKAYIDANTVAAKQ